MGLKYNLYIDELGIANLCDYSSRFFLLAGIVIEDKTTDELSSYFKYIKRRYSLPEEKNFHAVGLFETRTSDFYLSHSLCKKFCVSVSEFIETSPIHIWLLRVDKRVLRTLLKMPQSYQFKGSREHKEDKDIGYEILSRKMFFEFARFLKDESAHGAIIAESRQGADYHLLKTFLQCKEPTQFNHNSRLQKYAQWLRGRVFSICFENKRGLSAGLEIADLVSYLGNRKVSRRLATLEPRGGKLLWRIVEKNYNFTDFSPAILKRLAGDRINKIAIRIRDRMALYHNIVRG